MAVNKKSSEAFGDLEFEWDLKELLDKDPIAALGFDPKKAKYNLSEWTDNAYYLRDKPMKKRGLGTLGEKDDILYGPQRGSSKDTIVHEYRHRGHKLLKDAYENDPVGFVSKYGQDTAEFLLDESDHMEELRAELGDNPDATFVRPRPSNFKNQTEELLYEVVGPEIGKVSDSIQILKEGDREKYAEVYEKLKMAAADILKAKKEYNEGGMATDEQTEAVFKSSRTGYALGGEVGEAPDTTVGVDPESGNEVPLGAMPEEVRDDIPAQLSEGEYVVPADVVRFYGVKFFEDLRTQAKAGYQEMEENGRIGGEPVGQEDSGMEMVEPEDDLPFDISELQTVDDEEMPVGYDEGGLEVGTPLFNEGIESLFTDPVVSQQREQRVYVGPNGETAILTFIDGKPDAASQSLIDMGYKPEGEQSTTPANAAPTVEAPTSKPIVDKPSSNKDDYNDANLRAFEKEQEQVEKSASRFEGKSAKELIDYGNKLVDGSLGKAAKGVTALNPMLGTIAGVARRAEIFNVSKGLKEKYQEAMTSGDTRAAEEIDKAFQNITSRGKETGSGVLGGGGLLGGGGVLRDVDGNGVVDFGDTWLGDLLGFDAGGAGINTGPNQSDSWNGARRVGGTGKLSHRSLKDFYGDTSLKSHALGTQPKSKAAAAKSNSQPSASQAIQSWQNATAAVKANSGDTTSPAYHAAIKAQSDASRAATAAIKAGTSSKKANKARTAAKVKDIKSGKNTSGQVGFGKGGLMSNKQDKK